MVAKSGLLRNLSNIFSGRRSHINSVLTPVFNESLDKMEKVSNLSHAVSNDKLHRMTKFLLYSSFGLIDSIFGETGEKAYCTKLINSQKTKELLQLYFISYFYSLYNNANYRKLLGTLPKKDVVADFWSRIFNDKQARFRDMVRELDQLDTAARIPRLYEQTMSIVLGTSLVDKPSQQLQDSMLFAAHYNANMNAFADVLRKKD